MLLSGASAVEREKQALNELNVFPVPDGDTGTNMSLTLNAASEALLSCAVLPAGDVADIIAKSLLRGARGNSGVILSLLFRGFAKHLRELSEIDGAQFAAALKCGVETAYGAVMKPAEGTILTVSRVAAAAGEASAAGCAAIESVMAACVEAADAALGETVYQNPVLLKAGVIDAGARGFCVMLSAMQDAMLGNTEALEFTPSAAPSAQAAASVSEDIKFAYCTEFIVEKDDGGRDVLRLRAYLDSIGDSLVLVDDDEIIKVHVHTNKPGRALEEGLKYGPLASVKIDNMRKQHTEKVILTGAAPVRPGERVIAAPEKPFGFVAVAAGDGIFSVLRDLGVDQIIEGGQTMNPSTEDILRGVDLTPAETVFVLPNNKNIIMAAEQCILMSDKNVVIIPTTSLPQAVAALLCFEMERTEAVNRENMLHAIKNVLTGQVTYAARNSDFDGRKIKEGDYLCILERELIATGKDIDSVLKKLAARMSKKQPEFVSIFYGGDVDAESAEKTAAIFRKECKNAEIGLVYGGQPVYFYLVSAE